MSVTLTPELEAMIPERVESGRYHDASAVVGDAMQLLRERERLERLRALLEVGRQEELRGALITCAPELMDEIYREAAEVLLRGEEPDRDVCP